MLTKQQDSCRGQRGPGMPPGADLVCQIKKDHGEDVTEGVREAESSPGFTYCSILSLGPVNARHLQRQTFNTVLKAEAQLGMNFT